MWTDGWRNHTPQTATTTRTPKVRIETLCMNIINFVVLLVRDDISICYPYHYCYCHYYSFLVKRCAWCAVGLVGASIDKLPRAVGKVVGGGGGWRLSLGWPDLSAQHHPLSSDDLLCLFHHHNHHDNQQGHHDNFDNCLLPNSYPPYPHIVRIWYYDGEKFPQTTDPLIRI